MLFTLELLGLLSEVAVLMLGFCTPARFWNFSSKVLLSYVWKPIILIVKLENLQNNMKSLSVKERLNFIGC